MTPTLAELAAALLAVLEGSRLTAYPDSGGVWTIGIGHTGPEVHAGVTITPDEAVALFAADQAPLLALVADKPALAGAGYVSFGFNCGRAALQRVLAGEDSIDNPVHTRDRHGNVLRGLVERRRLEYLLIQMAG